MCIKATLPQFRTAAKSLSGNSLFFRESGVRDSGVFQVGDAPNIAMLKTWCFGPLKLLNDVDSVASEGISFVTLVFAATMKQNGP